MKKAVLIIASLCVSYLAYSQEDVFEEHTTTTTGQQQINTNVNMGIPNMGINVNMSVPGVQQTTTTTTTTTRTTSTPPPPAPSPAAKRGCTVACSSADFTSMKNSISSKPFEDSKVQIAKQIIGSNCVSSAQVRDLMNLFSYEESKLDIAKFAFSRCTDPNNYYKVNDAFTYSSSIDDLNNFIEGK